MKTLSLNKRTHLLCSYAIEKACSNNNHVKYIFFVEHFCQLRANTFITMPLYMSSSRINNIRLWNECCSLISIRVKEHAEFVYKSECHVFFLWYNHTIYLRHQRLLFHLLMSAKKYDMSHIFNVYASFSFNILSASFRMDY
jgi:hypothetical protein